MSEPVTEIRAHERVLHIAVLARLLDETSARKLTDDVLTAAAERTSVPIVLDMGLVRFAPSVALGCLAQLSKSFKLDGRRIALVRVDRHVLSTIRVTRLDAVIEIHDTLEDVLGPQRRSK